MKKDSIDNLFEAKKGALDIHEPSTGHKDRFLEKLQGQQKTPVIPLSANTSKRNYWKYVSIAASIALLVTVVGSSLFQSNQNEELAGFTPQLQETHDFFSSSIQMQLEEIDKITTPQTKTLVEDVMKQLAKLEKDYENLKQDLINSGNDKRVISAMIKNFKKRADLLEKVLEQMNTVNELKLQTNENNIL